MTGGAERGNARPGEERIVEGHLEVPRTARYALVEGDGTRTREVWWVLHGYRQLARRFLRRFLLLDDGTRRIVAPEGLSRFYLDGGGRHGPEARVGASWMTREDRLHEIRDYVRYLDRLRRSLRVAGAPETVLGFSQGVATAVRWVVGGEVRPARLILWGDTLPPDVEPAELKRALQGVELVLVRGRSDPAIEAPRVAQEDALLQAAAISARRVVFDGGHELHGPTLQDLARGGGGGGASSAATAT